ncbi:MAG: hypothetical protein ACOYEV_04765 [Candidatus Nanopelagicales bacterium]
MIVWRRGAALAVVVTTLAFASSCSLLPHPGPKAPTGIDLTKGDYAVIYSDSLTSEAGASTIAADGSLLQSLPLTALGLRARADSNDLVVLIGERAADIVAVDRAGEIHTGAIDYPDGTGATATAILADHQLASLINVGNIGAGYSNPLVIHDLAGKPRRSLPLLGYFRSMIVIGDRLLIAGQISDPRGDEDGSRLLVVDPVSLKVSKSLDWPEEGGLDQCIAVGAGVACLETEGFADGARTRLANHLVSIDLKTGKKRGHTDLRDDGVLMTSCSGRVYVGTRSAMNLLSPDLTRVESRVPLAEGDQAIETAVCGSTFLDVFVRDYDRVLTADGRADIGRIVRLKQGTLKVLRQTPMQFPDQQLVGVHVIPNEFFTSEQPELDTSRCWRSSADPTRTGAGTRWT